MKEISKFLTITLLISITALGCKIRKPIDDENKNPDLVEEEQTLE